MKKDYLGKVLSFLTVAMFIGVFFTVMTQIITRFLPVSFPWTEELSRLLFVSAVCFGAPVAFRDYEFVIVDILVDKLPKRARAVVDLLINIGIILLFAIILRYGILLTINGHRQMSATLPIKMSLAYGMIPLSALCFIYYGTLNIVKVIKNDILIKIKAGK